VRHLREVILANKFGATGKTKHFLGTVPAPVPWRLVIAQPSQGNGYYLLHFDENGEEITDTYHESISEAMSQAEWEFEIPESAWATL
jgi:hypothetical protein